MNANDFELTMQDPPRMNERLRDLADLNGETILASFDTHDTKDGHVVIVTDCFNWLVLNAESGSCGEDLYIDVTQPDYAGKLTLAYFVPAKRLFDAGCINASVYAVLQAEEAEQKKTQDAIRANRLRAQLAELTAKTES